MKSDLALDFPIEIFGFSLMARGTEGKKVWVSAVTKKRPTPPLKTE